MYCDMTTDNGGWTLMYSYNRVAGEGNPLVEGVIPTSPTTGYSHVHLDDLGYIGSDLRELRFECTSSGHSRKVHFKLGDSRILNIANTGDQSTNSPTPWQTTTHMSDHTGFLPDVANMYYTSATGGFHDYPFGVAGSNNWAIAAYGNRFECDLANMNTGFDTMHRVWGRLKCPRGTGKTDNGCEICPDGYVAVGVDGVCEWVFVKDYSCSTLLDPTTANQDGVYNVASNDAITKQVYCDMTTDGGGWTLMYSYNRVAGEGNPLVEGVIPTSPTTGYSHVHLDDLGYIGSDLRELRFECTSSGHSRKVHFKLGDSRILNIANTGDQFGNTVAPWKATTRFSDHIGFLPDATANLYTSPTGGFHDYPFGLFGAFNWAIAAYGNRFECDLANMNTGFDTMHRVWGRLRCPIGFIKTSTSCEKCPAGYNTTSVDGTECIFMAKTGSFSCATAYDVNTTLLDGIYAIQRNQSQDAIPMYCDMTTDGGGWTLLYSYNHVGNTNAPLVEGVIPLSVTSGYSHVHLDDLGYDLADLRELRFECTTNAHDRQLHFKTSSSSVLGIATTGSQVGNTLAGWQTNTKLVGHSAFLPDAASSLYNGATGGYHDFPFYEDILYHYAIRGFTGTVGQDSWECDDNANNYAYTTMHRVWGRLKCPMGTYNSGTGCTVCPTGYTSTSVDATVCS